MSNHHKLCQSPTHSSYVKISRVFFFVGVSLHPQLHASIYGIHLTCSRVCRWAFLGILHCLFQKHSYTYWKEKEREREIHPRCVRVKTGMRGQCLKGLKQFVAILFPWHSILVVDFFGGKNEDVLSKFFRMKNKYYFSLQRINVRFAVHTPATFFSGILSRNVALNCSSYPAFPAFFFFLAWARRPEITLLFFSVIAGEDLSLPFRHEYTWYDIFAPLFSARKYGKRRVAAAQRSVFFLFFLAGVSSVGVGVNINWERIPIATGRHVPTAP